jgi:hypothetical protein
LEASLVIVPVALKAPATFGAKEIVMTAFCPAAIDAGKVGLVTVKYLVEIDALVIVIALCPVLVAEIESALLVPAFTLPKLRVALENDSAPTAGWEFGLPALTP